MPNFQGNNPQKKYKKNYAIPTAVIFQYTKNI